MTPLTTWWSIYLLKEDYIHVIKETFTFLFYLKIVQNVHPPKIGLSLHFQCIKF